MSIVHISKADFINKVWDIDANPSSYVFKGDKPAIVDFFAVWCGPCRMLSPVLEELATEYEGKVDFYKVDIDEQAELDSFFNIQVVPTLMFFPMSGQVRSATGFLAKEQLKKAISEIFSL